MNNGELESPDKRVWQQCYKAALFELDANRVSEITVEDVSILRDWSFLDSKHAAWSVASLFLR